MEELREKILETIEDTEMDSSGYRTVAQISSECAVELSLPGGPQNVSALFDVTNGREYEA